MNKIKLLIAKLKKLIHSKHCTLVIHTFGYSSVGDAVFLQILVFLGILYHERFIAVENNPVIGILEIGEALFALLYFSYQYRKFLVENK